MENGGVFVDLHMVYTRCAILTHTQDPWPSAMRQPTLSRWRRFTCQNETTQGKNCFAASVCVIAGAPKRGGGKCRRAVNEGLPVDEGVTERQWVFWPVAWIIWIVLVVFRVKLMMKVLGCLLPREKPACCHGSFPCLRKRPCLIRNSGVLLGRLYHYRMITLRVDDHFLSSSKWKLRTFTHLELGLDSDGNRIRCLKLLLHGNPRVHTARYW